VIPSVFVAGCVLAGFGAALVKASQHTADPVAIVAGGGCIAFGILFTIVGVIA